MEVARSEVCYITLVDAEIVVFADLVAKLIKPKAGYIKEKLTDEEHELLCGIYEYFGNADELQPVSAVKSEMSTTHSG